jgi:DNA-binding IclR family transcriptional regulator
VALLREHPKGLSPSQVWSELGVTKTLTPTMATMLRDGLLRRVASGRYGLCEEPPSS